VAVLLLSVSRAVGSMAVALDQVKVLVSVKTG
jgi:hypothetical protein